MTPTVLFAAPDKDWTAYAEVLPDALRKAGVAASLVRTQAHDPADVDYIVYAPTGWLEDFSPYTNAKAVLSLWAGVEKIVDNQTLTMPLARMVEDGLTEGMVEWCVGHTLRHHLGMDRDIVRHDAHWDPQIPPLARNRRVSVLGLGQLGVATAQALAALRFPVTGWSRTPKAVDGVRCVSGEDGLREALSGADILILLLPLTSETEDLLDAERFAMLPRGAFVLNPGRGPLIVDDALLAALETGRVAHATLDVFRQEPLPEDHPFWRHPKVTVTPHIASETRAATASEVLAENIRRGEAGEPFLHLVDRSAGY